MHEVHRILVGARPAAGRHRRPGELAAVRPDLAASGPLGGGQLRLRGHPAAAHRPGALPVEARRITRRRSRSGADSRHSGSGRSGRTTGRPCTCASRSPTCCAPRAGTTRRYDAGPRDPRQAAAVLGDDHPHTLQTAGSLAADLRALGQFREALDHGRGDLRQLQGPVGADEPTTLSAANNLAVDLRLVGDCFRARDIDADTLSRPAAGPRPRSPVYAALRRDAGARHARGWRLRRFLELLRDDPTTATRPSSARTSWTRCAPPRAWPSRCARWGGSMRRTSSPARPASGTRAPTARTTRRPSPAS